MTALVDHSQVAVCDDWEDLAGEAGEKLMRGCGAALRYIYCDGADHLLASALQESRGGIQIFGVKEPAVRVFTSHVTKPDLFGRDLRLGAQQRGPGPGAQRVEAPPTPSSSSPASAATSSWIRSRSPSSSSLSSSSSPAPWAPDDATPLDRKLLEGLDPVLLTEESQGVPSVEPGQSCDSEAPEQRQEHEVSLLPIAERFRLAYESRDRRLAPKRGKNERQNERRADRSRRSDQKQWEMWIDSVKIDG
mmetsp:Transcript_15587/g.18793  ORF Transcript_15587/g.18793 Transcript_15587/m.18793 type:complete len:248 (+) Transcript_15587:2-745(+)